MTSENPDDQRPRLPRTDVQVVHLAEPVLAALVEGDLAAANAASPVPLTAAFADPDWHDLWQMRRDQVRADPGSAAWVTGVIWDAAVGVPVGRAGFHGPPDRAGMVEIGYTVLPEYRRHGYAAAALATLLLRAAREPAVRTVRLTIAPDNLVSAHIAARFGFVQVGEQWDDRDGLEIVYERAPDDLPPR